jgi:rhodanese-related sulfurtransferase
VSDIAFEITPAEVKGKLDSGERLALIDFRRTDEYQITRIEGSELIPMDTIPSHLDRLDQLADEATLVIFCHHGIRSANVVNWLRGQGVTNSQSMAGGIDRWSTEIDPRVPRY